MLRGKIGVEVRYDPFGNPIGGLSSETIQPWMQEKSFHLVKSIGELAEIIEEAIQAKYCAVDTESQGLNTQIDDTGKPTHRMVGISLCYDGITGYYIPVRHRSFNPNPNHSDNDNLPSEQVFALMNRLFEECICVYANAAYDMEIFWAEGLKIPNRPEDCDKYEDTQIMGWLIDSNIKRIGLKARTAEVLGWNMIEFKQLFPRNTKNLKIDDLHPEEVYVYACSDAICTYALWKIYSVSDVLAAQKTIYRIEKMLIPVLREMQRNMVQIDVPYLTEMRKELATKADGLVAEIRRLCNDPNLNVDSPRQLGETLFDVLKVPNAGRTDNEKNPQWKTDADTLEELDKQLQNKYPALTMVVKYRETMKLISTYIDPLINNLNERDEGKFGINACGAPTGRFAAPGGDPEQGYTGVNAQAIPKVSKDKPNIRKAIKARKGYKIVGIDFAGVELRIVGNLSDEANWISEFNHLPCVQKYSNDYEVVGDTTLSQKCPYCRKKMGDIHSQTSMNVFGDADDKHRSESKGINFGIVYGAGGKTLARNIGVTVDEGFRIQKAFLDSLPGLKRWIQKQKDVAKKTQKVLTSFGRIRLIPEMLSDEKGLVAFGERTSLNSPVQGTSADITKIAMVAIHKLIIKKGWVGLVKMLLTVHDEIVFEIHESILEEACKAIAELMCGCAPKTYKIGLKVDVEYGDNWGEIKGMSFPEPKLRPKRSGLPLLHADDIPYGSDTPVQATESPKPVSAPPTEAPKPEVSVSVEPSPVELAPQEPTLSQTFEYIVTKPYTSQKWRKLEALFILCGEGTTKLKLVSESGNDLAPNREILIDPLYFKYKAIEWGV